MWDPPRPGLEPASPALAGGLSTTAPPGKPLGLVLMHNFIISNLYVVLTMYWALFKVHFMY